MFVCLFALFCFGVVLFCFVSTQHGHHFQLLWLHFWLLGLRFGTLWLYFGTPGSTHQSVQFDVSRSGPSMGTIFDFCGSIFGFQGSVLGFCGFILGRRARHIRMFSLMCRDRDPAGSPFSASVARFLASRAPFWDSVPSFWDAGLDASECSAVYRDLSH